MVEWTRRRLGLGREVLQTDFFRRRSRLFLATNVQARCVRVWAEGKAIGSGKSDADGHFFVEVAFPLKAHPPGSTMAIATDPRLGDGIRFHGKIYFPKMGGYGLISDIDDTIKISGVQRSRQEVLADIFSMPYHAFPGMVSALQAEEERGANVFYLSAQPWQLMPVVEEWRATSGLPAGEYGLQVFRSHGENKTDLFRDTTGFKRNALDKLLREFPDWSFLLSGDTTQQDAQVYAEIARRHPGRIAGVWLHNTGGVSEAELRAQYHDLPHVPLKIHHGRWEGGSLR